jgi:hypothetical protein
MMQGLNPRIEDSASQELIVYDQEVRVRDSQELIYPSDDTLPQKNETRTRTSKNSTTGTMLKRRIPASVKSYPLIHETIGAGAFDYPASDQKYAGRCDFNGTRAILIQDHARLKPTNKISIAMWIYLPATAVSDPIHYIVTKEKYLIQVDDHASAPNQIRARVVIGGNNYDLVYTYTPNTWFHLAVTWKSPDFKLYVNGALQTSRSDASGTLDTSTKPLAIGTANNGGFTSTGFTSTGFVVV